MLNFLPSRRNLVPDQFICAAEWNDRSLQKVTQDKPCVRYLHPLHGEINFLCFHSAHLSVLCICQRAGNMTVALSEHQRKIYHSSYQWLGESSNVVTQNSELWYFELIASDFNSSLQASLLSFWQCLVNLTTNPLTPDSRLVRSSPPSCWNRIASKKGRNCPRPCTTTGNISWSSKTDVP